MPAGLDRIMREDLKPNYLAKGPRYGEILDLCMAMALSLGPHVFERQSIALREPARPARKPLRAVTVPTLILCGRQDALCPVERHELMHDLVAGSRLVIVE